MYALSLLGRHVAVSKCDSVESPTYSPNIQFLFISIVCCLNRLIHWDKTIFKDKTRKGKTPLLRDTYKSTSINNSYCNNYIIFSKSTTKRMLLKIKPFAIAQDQKQKKHQLPRCNIHRPWIWRVAGSFFGLIEQDIFDKLHIFDGWVKNVCNISPCTCSTVILALSRVILASGGSSWKKTHIIRGFKQLCIFWLNKHATANPYNYKRWTIMLVQVEIESDSQLIFKVKYSLSIKRGWKFMVQYLRHCQETLRT